MAVLPLFRETIRWAGAWLRMVRVVGCDYTVEAVGLAVEPGYADLFTRMLLDNLEQGERVGRAADGGTAQLQQRGGVGGEDVCAR